MRRIWPGAIVTENTLHVHTMAVRKAFGPYRYLLKTESRRGLRLLGDWTVSHHDAARSPAVAADAGRRRISDAPFSRACDTPGRADCGGGAVAGPHVRLASGNPDRTRRNRQNQPRLESRPRSCGRLSRRRLVGRIGVAVGSGPGANSGGGSAQGADRAHQRHTRNHCAFRRRPKAAPRPRQGEHLIEAVATLVETLLARCPQRHVDHRQPRNDQAKAGYTRPSCGSDCLRSGPIGTRPRTERLRPRDKRTGRKPTCTAD
jgi:hypothetical protein